MNAAWANRFLISVYPKYHRKNVENAWKWSEMSLFEMVRQKFTSVKLSAQSEQSGTPEKPPTTQV